MDRKQLEAFKSTILKMILREDEVKPPPPVDAEQVEDNADQDTKAAGGSSTATTSTDPRRNLGNAPATRSGNGLAQGNVPGSMSKTTPQSSESSSGYKLDGERSTQLAFGSDAYDRARYGTSNSSPSRVSSSETGARARDRAVTDTNQRNATGGAGPGRGATDRNPSPREPTDNPAYGDTSPNATAASRSGGSSEPARTPGSSTSTSSTGTAPREPRRTGTSTSRRGTVTGTDGKSRPATLADRNAGTFKPTTRGTWTTDASKVELDDSGKPLSINSDGSFNYVDPNSGEWQSGGPPKRSTAPSQPTGSARDESSATRQGRVAQRIGDLAFRPARNADEDRRKREAEADVEAAYDEADRDGRKIGYEDAATLYRGFDRRGYGGGGQPARDAAALSAKAEEIRRTEPERREEWKRRGEEATKQAQAAKLRLDQMRGKFGRPTPAGRERFSTRPEDRPGGYSR